MRKIKKTAFDVDNIRRVLEPGPVVLVSSAHAVERNVMTTGWHMILGDGPSLAACHIWDRNHSRGWIRKSRECVTNVPTFDLTDAVIGVGNTHGPAVDTFAEFGLTPVKAKGDGALLIEEGFANFERRPVDDSQAKKYRLFVFECLTTKCRGVDPDADPAEV